MPTSTSTLTPSSLVPIPLFSIVWRTRKGLFCFGKFTWFIAGLSRSFPFQSIIENNLERILLSSKKPTPTPTPFAGKKLSPVWIPRRRKNRSPRCPEFIGSFDWVFFSFIQPWGTVWDSWVAGWQVPLTGGGTLPPMWDLDGVLRVNCCTVWMSHRSCFPSSGWSYHW